VAPQLLWFKKLRTNVWSILAVAMCVNVGMWFERFVIIVTSLTRDFLPSSWASYSPTWVDLGMLAGSFGLFFTCFLLFLRFGPVVAMAEVKTVMPEAHVHGEHATADEKKSDYWPDEHHGKQE
jgi:molybdopterin-containing oxidoreductase family membrane subunit